MTTKYKGIRCNILIYDELDPRLMSKEQREHIAKMFKEARPIELGGAAANTD